MQAENDMDEKNIPINLANTNINDLMPELDEVVEEVPGGDNDREGENAAEVKELLLSYYRAGHNFEQYRNQLGRIISKREFDELTQRQTEMENKFHELRDRVECSIQVQQDFVREDYRPFTRKVSDKFRRHEDEHKKLRAETSDLAAFISALTNKQNIINTQNIAAGQEVLFRLQALNGEKTIHCLVQNTKIMLKF